MARTKQAGHTATASKAETIDLDGDSSDEMGTDRESTKPSQSKPKANAAATKTANSKVAVKESSVASSKAAKGKGKAKIDLEADEDDMDVDTVAGKPLKKSAARNQEAAELAEENERLRRRIEELSVDNAELQQMAETIIAERQSTQREIKLQEEIEYLNAVVERGRTLLDLRNSEYTKSKLINTDPNAVAEWVTMEWAEENRAQAVEEYATKNEQLKTKLVSVENALKAERKEAAEAKRQLESMRRELEAEVEHSKKLQADIGRRPTPAAPVAPTSRNVGPQTRELENKLELLESLSGVGILGYTESVRPGNIKSMTYSCLLSLEGQEFPFKLVAWEGKAENDVEPEHVVYSPGEPIDPELQLDYLVESFTFPRNQLATFYQNMINILGASRGEEEEE